jgi:predicted porin
MNKKLLALAFTGAFAAAPLAAMAQSTVTISGSFKISVENVSLSNYGGSLGIPVARPAATTKSEGRLADDSSRIVFNVVENLGGGLRAVAQADMRINVANPSSGLPPMSGNTHVGLRGSWGQIRAGLQDLHYAGRESYLTDKGDLRADSISILAFAAGGGTAIANASGGTAITYISRTPNVVFYDSPELWGGFRGRIAYSFSPADNGVTGTTNTAGRTTGAAIPPATSADIGSSTRRGRAWNLNPNWSAAGFNLGYSYWSSKVDNPNGFPAGATGSMDQRGDRLYGSYLFPMGLRIGLAWDKSKLMGAQTALATNGATLSNRTAWSFPVSYAWGPHEIHVHYDFADNDKAAGNGLIAAGANTKATMFAASYQYNLSKRTSLALTYAQINNGAQATYNLYSSVSLGSADASPKAGENPRLWSLTMRQAF